MADGSVWEFHLNQSLNGQVVKNVFHYRSRGSADITVSIGAVGVAWGTAMIAAMSNVQVSQLGYVDIFVKHLAGFFEESTIPLTGTAGALAGDPLPPHDAFAFRYNRATTLTRHGQKRVAGISEGWNHNGVVDGPTELALLDVVAAQMAHVVDSADGLNTGAELWPVIYSKYLNGELRAEPISNLVSSVQYVRISTQNTRKLYR